MTSASHASAHSPGIGLVGFDGDDTLWKSEDFYRQAEQEFESILGHYVDLHDAGTAQHLLKVERRNLTVFGYGAKGMTLSMIEAAIELTDERISAAHLRQIVEIGRRTLQHPVEVIDGVREAVSAIAARWPVVLITKGDLFHQEQKMQSAVGVLNGGKALKYKDYGGKWRRSRRRSCGPVRPDMAHSCPDFAPIMEAA